MTTSYCTPAEIRNAVAGTNKGAGTCAALETPQLQDACDQGTNTVAAYVGTDYQPTDSQPAVTVPPLLHDLALSLAIYYATLTYLQSKDLSPQDPVYLRYLDAIRQLKDISNGVIDPVPPTPGTAPTGGVAHVFNTIPALGLGSPAREVVEVFQRVQRGRPPYAR